MISEKTFEDILSRYPALIEEGLILTSRQAVIYGRRIDLLFKDKHSRDLLIELKIGPIKDEHIGQIMSYEGMLLSADNPSIRVMLIGNRVPPNIGKALDHHGIAWKEISFKTIEKYLCDHEDEEFLPLFEVAQPLLKKIVAKAVPQTTQAHINSPSIITPSGTKRFATMSPTHVSGKKNDSWAGFRDGGYIAFGSTVCDDLQGKTEDEIGQLIDSIPRYNPAEAARRKREYAAFLALEPGDIVAINNTNDGLFGIGRITSGYYFKPHAHNTGTSDVSEHYNHFHDVEWLVADYLKRTELIQAGEKGWAPYGIITLYQEIPPYVLRVFHNRGLAIV